MRSWRKTEKTAPFTLISNKSAQGRIKARQKAGLFLMPKKSSI
jgi:hypothetical protein